MNHEEEKSYVIKQTARVGNGFRLFGSLIEANGGFFQLINQSNVSRTAHRPLKITFFMTPSWVWVVF